MDNMLVGVPEERRLRLEARLNAEPLGSARRSGAVGFDLTGDSVGSPHTNTQTPHRIPAISNVPDTQLQTPSVKHSRPILLKSPFGPTPKRVRDSLTDESFGSFSSADRPPRSSSAAGFRHLSHPSGAAQQSATPAAQQNPNSRGSFGARPVTRSFTRKRSKNSATSSSDEQPNYPKMEHFFRPNDDSQDDSQTEKKPIAAAAAAAAAPATSSNFADESVAALAHADSDSRSFQTSPMTERMNQTSYRGRHPIRQPTVPEPELRSTIVRVESENCKIRIEVEQLRTRNAQLETKVDAAAERLAEEKRLMADYNKRLEQTLKTTLNDRDLMRVQAVNLVRDLGAKERSESERNLQTAVAKLGGIVVQRTGTSLQEVWEDGPELRDIDQRLSVVREAKKAIKAIAPSSHSQPISSSPELTPPEESSLMAPPPPPRPFLKSDPTLPYEQTAEFVAEQDEILKLRAVALRREENSLVEQRRRLEWERGSLAREIKRMRDEKASRFKHFNLLNERYVMTNLLGRGGFSEVFKAFDVEGARWVACKVHQLNSCWSEEKKRSYIRHAEREYKIHRSMQHPRVVRLLDCFEIDCNSFCTVLEYCEGMDLDQYLKLHKTLSEREARSIISQVFSGLLYLNSQPQKIIHYDLKPGNILFHNGEIKITDFGLSKVMEESQSTMDGMELTSQGAGTYWYLPPECFRCNGKPQTISSKVDVWSTGVILYQLLFGKKPFGNEMTQEAILRENVILTSELEFPQRPLVSAEVKMFISRCLTRNQVERPDIRGITQDPYLRVR